MRTQPLQPHSRNIAGILCTLIAIIFIIVPFLFINPVEFNVTTIINHHEYRLFAVPCFLLSMTAMYLLFRMQKDPLGDQAKVRRNSRILLGFIAATVFIPYYDGRESLFSGFHVLLGFFSFLWINRILLDLFRFQRKTFSVYLCLLALVYLLALTFASVNGLCEIIYYCGIAVLLNREIES